MVPPGRGRWVCGVRRSPSPAEDGLKRRRKQKTPKLLDLCPTEGDKAWLGRVSFLVDFASGFFVSFVFLFGFFFFPFF